MKGKESLSSHESLSESSNNHPISDSDSPKDPSAANHNSVATTSTAQQEQKNKEDMIATSPRPELPILMEKLETLVETPALQTLGERLRRNLEFTMDGGPLCQEFVDGVLSEQYLDNPNEELQFQYFQQCLRSLDWSCGETIVRTAQMLPIFAGAIEEMHHFIKHAFSSGNGLQDHELMRDKLPLDTAPFKYPKKQHLNIQELHKDDDLRIAFQVLFLFVLRLFIPLKYDSLQSFLEKYPQFKDRNPSEQIKLRNTANWMDLTFYALQPRNNKTFLLNVIPRIVEGKTAKYITGSGQTKATSDRVHLYRSEGHCEKIKRPPRRKKEEILAANAAARLLLPNNANDRNSAASLPTAYPGLSVPPAASIPPFLFPYFPPGMIPPKEMQQRYQEWQQAAINAATAAAMRSGSAGGVGGAGANSHQDYRNSPASSSSSATGNPLLTNNPFLNFPWLPPSNSLPTSSANQYNNNNSSNNHTTHNNSHSHNNGSNLPSTAFPVPNPYLYPPYFPPPPPSSSSSSSSAAAASFPVPSSSSVTSPFAGLGGPADLTSNPYLQNFYLNYAASLSNASNNGGGGGGGIAAFPSSVQPSNAAFPLPYPNSKQNPVKMSSNNNSYHNGSNHSSSSDEYHPYPSRLTGGGGRGGEEQDLDMVTQQQQPKRKKGSSSPTSTDYLSRISQSQSSITLSAQQSSYPPPPPHIDPPTLEGSSSSGPHLKPSANSTDGGLDALLAVAGSMENSPNDQDDSQR